jgi:hypothetical protein
MLLYSSFAPRKNIWNIFVSGELSIGMGLVSEREAAEPALEMLDKKL